MRRSEMDLMPLIEQMATHAEENPRHGFNCSCKDPIIRAARRELSALDQRERDEACYLFNQLLKELRR